MGMKYTQVPENTFDKIQINAGIFCRSFNPATGAVSGIIGATTGGGSFTASPEFTDFGEDIDNCPRNTKELKRIDDITVTLSTTLVTIDPTAAVMLAGAADIDAGDATHVIPRRTLSTADFADIWWVGDYSGKNIGEGAGFVAIHLKNALSTGGFQVQSTDRGKGNYALELTGHYSMAAPDTVPYEIYIKGGTESGDTPEILLEQHSATIAVGDTLTLNVLRLVPAGSTITWSSSATAKASVSGGVVTGVATGSATITAKITANSVEYSDTCTIVVVAAS